MRVFGALRVGGRRLEQRQGCCEEKAEGEMNGSDPLSVIGLRSGSSCTPQEGRVAAAFDFT